MSAAVGVRSPRLSWRRVGAMVLRYMLLFRGSWPRVFELMYWPTVQMILWGFITKFLLTNSTWLVEAAGVLIAAVLLWDTLFRAQLGFSLSFLEEMWSRNLGHLFVSPLRAWELVAAMMVMSFIRTLIGVLPAMALAIPLYHYSVFELGLPLIAFFVNLLMMGWAIGLLVSSLILRFGLGAESLAWLVVFLMAPLSAVYYPVTVLPGWLQPVAWALPSAHVFEGMRAILFEHTVRLDLMLNAVALNVLYIGLGVAVFLYTVHVARRRGLLLQMGE